MVEYCSHCGEPLPEDRQETGTCDTLCTLYFKIWKLEERLEVVEDELTSIYD